MPAHTHTRSQPAVGTELLYIRQQQQDTSQDHQRCTRMWGLSLREGDEVLWKHLERCPMFLVLYTCSILRGCVKGIANAAPVVSEQEHALFIPSSVVWNSRHQISSSSYHSADDYYRRYYTYMYIYILYISHPGEYTGFHLVDGTGWPSCHLLELIGHL